MASDNEASCASDPNFAVICSFLEKFGKSCGVDYPDINALQLMLENSQEGERFAFIEKYTEASSQKDEGMRLLYDTRTQTQTHAHTFTNAV